jgi:outer membrane lipoprotein-sorting protein
MTRSSTLYSVAPALLLGLSLFSPAQAQVPAAAPAAPAAPTAPTAPAAAAAPAASADSILARLDAGLSSFKDATFKFKMRIKEPNNGAVREVEFTTWIKGPKRRKVRFDAPGDIKGMGILVESPEVMYALLPQFGNRVRRVANHQTGGNFMGSDLTNDDMAVLEYSPLYSAKLLAAEGDSDVLELSLRPGKQSEWPRLKLWVKRDPFYPTKIEYFDAKGDKKRTCERLEYKLDNKAGTPAHYSPGKMVYTDHRRNNHQTELILVESKLDSGLADDLFTQRSLTRGQ